MIVSDVVMVESEPYRKLAGHIVCKFVKWWTGWDPIFIDYKSYTMVPGVAAPRDFLKVLWNVSLESKVIPRNFTRG